MTIFIDSDHFGSLWWQSFKTAITSAVFDGSAFLKRTLRGRFREKLGFFCLFFSLVMRFCGLISFLLLNLLAGQLIEAYPNSCQARQFFFSKGIASCFLKKNSKVMLCYQICQHLSLVFSHFRCFFSKFGGETLRTWKVEHNWVEQVFWCVWWSRRPDFFVPVKVWNFILFVWSFRQLNKIADSKGCKDDDQLD